MLIASFLVFKNGSGAEIQDGAGVAIGFCIASLIITVPASRIAGRSELMNTLKAMLAGASQTPEHVPPAFQRRLLHSLHYAKPAYTAGVVLIILSGFGGGFLSITMFIMASSQQATTRTAICFTGAMALLVIAGFLLCCADCQASAANLKLIRRAAVARDV